MPIRIRSLPFLPARLGSCAAQAEPIDVAGSEQGRFDASGRLQVAFDQGCCWMWTNQAGHPVTLQLLRER